MLQGVGQICNSLNIVSFKNRPIKDCPQIWKVEGRNWIDLNKKKVEKLDKLCKIVTMSILSGA
jgi:hypothetical protein